MRRSVKRAQLSLLGALAILGCARETVQPPPVRGSYVRPRTYPSPTPMSQLEPLLDLASVVPPLPEEVRNLVGCYRLELPPTLGEIGRSEWAGSGRSIVVGLSTDSYPLAAGMVVKVEPAKGSLRYASWREVDGEARIGLSSGMGGYSYRLRRSGQQVEAIAQYWTDAYFPNEWWEVDAEIISCPPFPKSFEEKRLDSRAAALGQASRPR